MCSDHIRVAFTRLPTGEISTLVRSGSDKNGPVSYTRNLVYDTLGRLVANVEPNTTSSSGHSWLYAYNDLGDLVGSSDARGCGENIGYDDIGRPVYEDYSPCTSSQPKYSGPPSLTSAVNAEAYYAWETSNGVQTGRLASVADRGSKTSLAYDGRGRVTTVAKQLAYPGSPGASLFSSRKFSRTTQYDDWDRVVNQTTGAENAGLPSFLDSNKQSHVQLGYSARGVVSTVQSGYGTLIASTSFRADGRPQSITYGNWTGRGATVATYDYDADPRQRLTEAKVTGPGPSATMTAQAAPSVLMDELIAQYDDVGNPLVVVDGRPQAEAVAGAEPATTTYAYDDSYRITQMTRTYATKTDTPQTPPLPATTKYQTPGPHSSAIFARVLKQSFAYDGLGNSISSSDDQSLFWSRSLGTIKNKNNQLTGASASAASLSASYDDAGNLATLAVNLATPGSGATTCPNSPSPCQWRYTYSWDEVGQLAEATHFDGSASTPTVDVTYSYNANGQRVARGSLQGVGTESPGTQSYNLEIFPSLRINHATWFGPFDYYKFTEDQAALYLEADGSVFGRVIPATTSGAPPTVYLQLGNLLGSVGVTMDMSTGQLIERTAFLPFGAVESEYQAPSSSFWEDYKFTGKEEDAEIGITYFGARYYSPYLGRWLSPDPLAIHALGADLNPYAYVHGRVTTAIDPNGLEGEESDAGTDPGPASDPASADGDGPSGAPATPTTAAAGGDNSSGSPATPPVDAAAAAPAAPAAAVTPASPGAADGAPSSQLMDAIRLAVFLAEVAALDTVAVVGTAVGLSPVQVGQAEQNVDYSLNHPQETLDGMRDKAETAQKVITVVAMASGAGETMPPPPAMAPAGPGGGPVPGASPLAPPAFFATKKGRGTRSPEARKDFGSFGEARADAIEKAAVTPGEGKPFVQELGPFKGRVTGRQSAYGDRGWRIDFDPRGDKGFHVNWWNGDARGANIVTGGTEADFWEILSHFP